MLRLIRKRSVPGSVVVVRLPAEIDSSNAEHIRERLCAALTPGVRLVVADLTGTTFCDVAGVRSLVRARNQATAMNAEIRLSVRPGPVRRVLTLVNLNDPFLIYASTSEATAAHAAAPLN
ncbi:MAG TPA: STAS domain-containing protein [Streptosporangiaceae bacterium]